MALFQSYTKYGIFPGVEMSIILECVTHLSYVHLQVIWNQYTYTCTLSSAQLISLLGGELLFFAVQTEWLITTGRCFPQSWKMESPKSGGDWWRVSDTHPQVHKQWLIVVSLPDGNVRVFLGSVRALIPCRKVLPSLRNRSP